ncbi:hypothetical protein FAF44_25875 [Nonomuraea sp. MG754425]|uniref:amidohydrolase family protein n=1 Tax=Nonomuraea sp. MG754425 TaxID=2570319 RepID=UPI001F1B74ED|nr:amidohydrolase family protein [Nonomuraea sp. MG754425]MCF6471798.1 hypothetical protein [Nonomuraea sp. MG754425]
MAETRPSLLDADAMLGRHPRRDVGGGTVRELLAALDRVGIAEAVVAGMTAWLHDPRLGNAQVLDLVADQPRLHPCWVMLPGGCDELGPGFVQEAVAGGVRAVRAFPRDHGYRLDGVEAAEVLRALARARLPLLVDAPQADWASIESIAAAHPELRIVVGSAGYRMLRQIAGVLDRRPNVYLGTADLSSHCGLEWLVARYGAGRIVFGTGQPYRDPAEAVTRLLWSELGDPDVAAIGRGIL